MNQWTKREAEIEGDIGTTVGMYGTQDGIVGKTLTSFKASTLPKDNADAKRVRFYRDRVRQLHRLRMPRDNPPDFINETYSRRTDVPTN